MLKPNRLEWTQYLGWLLFALCCLTTTPLYAQQSTDFLNAEGAPVSIARYLENGLRKYAASQKEYKLLANPMAPGMAQLTLGCTLDTADCVARLAKMRNAKVVFHLRVLPFGSRAKVVFRKLDGTTGKTIKSVSHRFRRSQLKQALALLKTKMFGGATPTARATPPVVARTTEPPARRVEPIARRVEPIARRVEPIARRVEPIARRVEPIARRVEPIARRVEPVARTTPPIVRVDPRVDVRPTPPVRTAAITPPIRTTPPTAVLPRNNPSDLGAPSIPDRRVAVSSRTKPIPTPTTPIWKRPSFWAWICVGVTVAAVGGTIAFGLDTQSKEGQIKQLIERSKQGEPISYKTQVLPLEDSGKTSAVLTNVFIGVGATTAAAAVVLFLLPKPKPTPPQTSLRNKQPTPLAKTHFSVSF